MKLFEYTDNLKPMLTNSKVTVERTLGTLVKEGYLIKAGGGRSLSYTKYDTR